MPAVSGIQAASTQGRTQRAQAGSILLLHNLADTTVTVDLGPLQGTDGDPYDLLVDGEYDAPTKKFTDLKLNGWGYRWIRLSRSDQG